MQKMKYIKYKCTECNAEDTDKVFPGERPEPCMNCWNCHAGQSIKTLHDQVMARIGMFPVETLPAVA